MSGIEITDFSGGMVTNVNEILMQRNTFKVVQNANVWDKTGSIIPLKALTNATNFPTGKSYDHHLIYPIHGTGDRCIIMMTDGNIYSYDGSSFTQITTVAGDRQAGARMVLAGNNIYVFYRNFAATPTIFRRIIYWDYDAVTPAFVVKDGEIQDEFEIVGITNAGTGATGNNWKFIYRITTLGLDGISESYGHLGVAYTYSVGKNDMLLKFSRTSGVENSYRFYFYPVYYDSTDGWPQFSTAQFYLEINGGSKKTFTPFIHGKITGSGTSIKTYATIGSAVSKWNALTYFCGRYVNNSENFIAPGHFVRVYDKTYEIDTITYNNTDPNNAYYELTLLSSLDDSFTINHDTEAEDQWLLFEVELAWHSNEFRIPVMFNSQNLLGVQVDENRPESRYLNGTGNATTFAKNRLVTFNPYWQDDYNQNKTEDKPGYMSWSFIKGDGSFSDLTIPNTNLLGSSVTASEIVHAINYRENILAFRKNGISRILFQGDIPFIFDISNEALEDDQHLYVDGDILIAYLNKRIKIGLLSRQSSDNSQLVFTSISDQIKDEIFSIDARIFYDRNENIIYISDVDNTDYGWMCYFKDNKISWQRASFWSVRIYSGFYLNNTAYFITRDGSGNYAVNKYATTGTTHVADDIVLEDKNYYLPMQNNFLRKLEVLYKFTTGVVTIKIYLDDVLVKTETLSSKTNLGFSEIKLDRSAVTRAEKFRWRLDANNVSSDFEFAGLFINRDQYTVETLKGY